MVKPFGPVAGMKTSPAGQPGTHCPDSHRSMLLQGEAHPTRRALALAGGAAEADAEALGTASESLPSPLRQEAVAANTTATSMPAAGLTRTELGNASAAASPAARTGRCCTRVVALLCRRTGSG